MGTAASRFSSELGILPSTLPSRAQEVTGPWLHSPLAQSLQTVDLGPTKNGPVIPSS
ncbi:MAG: hypothetical protein RJA70_3778 [Pseudomonadota bacterium]|jgi:hypothetical protein